MDKIIRLATKDNQEKVLAILGGEDAAGGGGLVQQMRTAVQEGTSGLATQVKEAMEKASGGMVRYQQPTNMLEFYARPKGSGIATAWRDPVDQAFYDRYGLADSIWEKTVIVANQDHMPKDAEDGITYTHTSRNLYRVADGEDVDRGNWYLWSLDPTKKTYFRFFAYGAEGVCNSNPKNAYTYDPNIRGGLIFGASKERLREFFRMSKGFGQAVRLGLGLTNEIVEGVNVAEFDRVNTYQEFLANQKFVNAATAQGNALELSAYWTKDFDTIMAFYNSAPKWFYQDILIRAMENADIVNSMGGRVAPAVAASDVAMKAILKNENAMNRIFKSQTAMQAVIASDVAMKAVAASDVAMKLLIASETLIRDVAASDVAMKALLDTKDVWTKHNTLSKTSGNFSNSTRDTRELVGRGGLFVATKTYNSGSNSRNQVLYSGSKNNISKEISFSSESSQDWNFIAAEELYCETRINGWRYMTLYYDHYTAIPKS